MLDICLTIRSLIKTRLFLVLADAPASLPSSAFVEGAQVSFLTMGFPLFDLLSMQLPLEIILVQTPQWLAFSYSLHQPSFSSHAHCYHPIASSGVPSRSHGAHSTDTLSLPGF